MARSLLSLTALLSATLAPTEAAPTATLSTADKGGYTLFDAPISTDAPPSTLFPANAGLNTWLPPRFLASGLVGSTPIPTNNWWGNMIAPSSDGAVQSVWTNPYVLRPILERAPYGLSVNYPYPNRFSDGSTGHGSLYYASAIATDFVVSATEFTSVPSFQVSSWDDLGVTVSFSPSISSSNKIQSTLVPGMGLITAKYTGLTPQISATRTILAINGAQVSPGASVIGTRFVFTLSTGQRWVLYAGGTIRLTLSTSQKLTASGAYWSHLRLALVTSDTQLAALDKSASCLLEGSNIEAKDTSSYMFHLKTSGDCSSGLFHYLQVHHIDTLDRSSAVEVTSSTAYSATRGPMTGVLTVTNPPVLRFTETQNVPVEFYPPRTIRSDIVANLKIKKLLVADLNANWMLTSNAGYYFNGKAIHKYANLCLMANDVVISGADKAVLLRQCLDKLEGLLAQFVANSWTYPLNYDTTYRGIISPAGLILNDINADFGNTMYNDHHYHYGYWIAASAIVNFLDPTWSGIPQLNRVTTFLIRDVANPSNGDSTFPKFRQFDWFRGHSYSHGITAILDGKDEESSSEDVNFHYAVALFGKATGNAALATVGQLMLKLNTRATQTYFLMTNDNRVHPPSIVSNKVSGIFFDNKVVYTTWFSSQPYAIHGIQMIPITPVTEYVRTATFVGEEWDAVVSKIPDVATTNVDNAWLSLIYANYATVNMALALEKLQVVSMDDGITRSWALYMAASSASTITPVVTTPTPTTPTSTTPTPTASTPTTPTPTTPTPTTPTLTTPTPTMPTPTLTTATPAPVTPAPTTVTPAPTTRTPVPTTGTPAPTTTPPVPTTSTPMPTAASGGSCGNDRDGPIACPTGQYCQPWNPSFYQCRSIGSALCGVQQTGVDFLGDDLATVQVPLPEQCCDRCRTTAGCAAYTFVNYNADGKAYCYLKKGTGSAKKAVGVVSAVITTASTTPAPTTRTPAPTTGTPAPTTGTPAPTTRTPAPTTGSPAPTTAAPACSTPSSGQCGSDATGALCCPSGQYCQPWNPSYYQCVAAPSMCGKQEPNVDYYGNDIKSIEGILPSECCSSCAATGGCVAYTFVNFSANGKSACYLKSNTGAKKAVVGAVSSTVLTPKPKCTFSSNADFYGNDLSSVTGLSSAAQCCDKCAATSRCAAFTFANAVCYLKTSAGTKSSLSGATAGVVN